MDFHIVERLGGSCRCVTLLTVAIHFLHSLFSVVNYLAWVRQPDSPIALPTQHAYLSMTIVCCAFYFLGASVFYMWAWRFPEPEEVAKRRRVYGVGIHVIFCDLPMFVVETTMVWDVRFSAAIFGFTYCLTCVSLCYSLLRVWFFFMVRIIKFRLPTAARLGTNYPPLSASARHDMDELDYRNERAGGGRRNNTNNNVAGSTTAGSSAGNTILLNRNAGLHSDGGASSVEMQPRASPERGNRVEHYHVASSTRYLYPSDGANSGAMQPTQQVYYGQRDDTDHFRGLPLRI